MVKTTANQRILNNFIEHQTRVLRYSKGLANKMQDVLAESNKRISQILKDRADELEKSYSLRRLNSINAQVAKVRKAAWGEVDKELVVNANAFAKQETLFVISTYEAESPVVLNLVMPSAKTIEAAVADFKIDGQPMGSWLSGLEVDDIARIRNTIASSMVSGDSVEAMMSRIESIENVTDNQLRSLVRTSIQEVANEARELTFLENSDILDKETFVATLDGRTTLECALYDGQVFNLGEGPVPPLHWNCRSVRVANIDADAVFNRPAKPVTHKMALTEFAKENNLRGIKSYDDLPYGYKGSFMKFERQYIRDNIGSVPETTNFSKFFATTQKSFQVEYLGVTKAELYRKGGLELKDFSDKNGMPLTLNELARDHKSAFEKAGLDPDKYIRKD